MTPPKIDTGHEVEIEIVVKAVFDMKAGQVKDMQFEAPDTFPPEMIQFLLNEVVNSIEEDKGKQEVRDREDNRPNVEKTMIRKPKIILSTDELY